MRTLSHEELEQVSGATYVCCKCECDCDGGGEEPSALGNPGNGKPVGNALKTTQKFLNGLNPNVDASGSYGASSKTGINNP